MAIFIDPPKHNEPTGAFIGVFTNLLISLVRAGMLNVRRLVVQSPDEGLFEEMGLRNVAIIHLEPHFVWSIIIQGQSHVILEKVEGLLVPVDLDVDDVVALFQVFAFDVEVSFFVGFRSLYIFNGAIILLLGQNHSAT